MESLLKNIQLMVEFPKGPFLVLHFSCCILMTFLVICNIAIYADDTTLYSKCDQASDLWQQLELSSELESDLQDTVDWGKKRLIDFNPGKTQLISFDQSSNNNSINVKMDGLFLKKNHLLRCLG